jgi:hypothetical protein
MDHGSRLRNFAERPCLPRDALTISSGDHGGLDERVFLLVIDPHQANNLIHPWDHQCLEGSQSMPTSDGHVLPTFIRALSARQRSGTLSRPSKSHFQHAGIRNPVAFSAVFRSPIRYNVTPAPHHQSSTRTSEAFPMSAGTTLTEAQPMMGPNQLHPNDARIPNFLMSQRRCKLGRDHVHSSNHRHAE